MQNDQNSLNDIGVVIIGRNEGDRLVHCLKSLITQTSQIVYVDSASTDDSVHNAHNLGAKVLSLDMSIPFTAARARNEGFELMRKLYPQTDYAQFVDGDCEMTTGWLASAKNFLATHQDVAVACGRRRERYPERSVYNMLCDMEWNTPVGEAKACGGDALIRVCAFEEVRGYRPSLIAGEEPELCVRLRAAGWRIWRLDIEMALHDAAMIRFGQWWKRTLRTGYAFAEGAHLHGAPPERHWVMEARRALIWGLCIPVLAVSLSFSIGLWGLTMLLVYPLQIIRLALRGTKSTKENWWRALFLVLGKFPEAIGQLKFFYISHTGRTSRLIEYK